MTGSLVDMFPPEMQTVYGAVAGVAAVAGLVIWMAGIKIARAAVAVLAGVVGAGVCAWSLPGPTHISPLTGAIIGFVAGVMAGAVTFRILQGILVAVCMALVACGIYYRMRVVVPVSPGAATMRAEQMLIPLDRLGEAAGKVEGGGKGWDVAGIVASMEGAAVAVRRAGVRQWEGIDAVHRQRITVLAGVTALAALVLSVIFPRHTTWIVSAALGTFLLLIAIVGLVQVFAPQYQGYIPTSPVTQWGVAVIVMLVGMLAQRKLFWAVPKAEAKAEAKVDPAHAAAR